MSLEWSDEIPNVTNVKVTPAKTVWGAKPFWIRKWKTKDHALEGFPAFRGPRGIVLAGWTGASKIYIRGDEHIIQLTERFGFRGKRHLDLATYDSIEVRHVPNQYFFLIGWMTVWMWGLGIIFIIWSYWKKHVFVILNFGFKSTTNESVTIRIDRNTWHEKVSKFEKMLNRRRD